MKDFISFKLIMCGFDDECANRYSDFSCINCTRNNRLKYLKDNFEKSMDADNKRKFTYQTNLRKEKQ